jgi:phage-related protein
MAQQIKIDIVADVQKLQQGVDQANKQLGGLDASVKKVQGLTTAFAGVAVAAKGFGIAGGFINSATDAASNLEETLSKTNVLFGQSATEVVKFASSAAKNFGQSKQQALDAAATFATFGKAAGLAGDDLVGFSTDFVGLASDLASFNNTSPEQAINAIGSALRGEAEPLRAYGVLLDDATLRQAALELGIVETTKNALTPQQKVLAAQKVIYDQTGAAQGDFARTSDGLANSQRILEAEQADLNANLGKTFLPVMKLVNEAMTFAVGVFTSLPGPVQKIIVVVGLAIAILGPFLILINSIKTAMVALELATLAKSAATKIATAAQWLFNAAMSANPIGLVILAIVAIIAIIVLLVKNWDTVTEVVGKVWNAIKNFASDAWEALKGFGSKVAGFVSGIVDRFQELPGQMLSVGKNIVTGLWNGIQGMAAWLRDKVTGFFKNLIPDWAEKALGISSPSKVFAKIGSNIVSGLASTFNAPAVKSVSNRAQAGIAVPSISLPSLMSRTSAAGINVTINAGLGTNGPALGRQVSSAIKQYGKVSTKARF